MNIHLGPSSRLVCLVAVTLFLSLSWMAPRAEEIPASAKEILDKVDDLYRGKSSSGQMTMTIITAHWKRTLTVAFWSEGKEKSLLRILAPKKEKGMATLRSGNEIWNYLPKVKRVIKLPSSMMSASWMGSHFTNDDLVKESRMADDYTFELTFSGERGGGNIVEVSCYPKPEAPIVWGKVEVEVRAEDYLPVSLRYYDEDHNLARTMNFTDIRLLGGRTLPTVMTVIPEDKPREKTVVRYEDITFDPALREGLFSLRSLQR